MYNVIIVFDEKRGKSYYHGYDERNPGNIQCEELPPYADPIKACSCFWENDEWTFDEEKYPELLASRQELLSKIDQAEKEANATPTINELSNAVVEIGDNVGVIFDALAELGNRVTELGQALTERR